MNSISDVSVSHKIKLLFDLTSEDSSEVCDSNEVPNKFPGQSRETTEPRSTYKLGSSAL